MSFLLNLKELTDGQRKEIEQMLTFTHYNPFGANLVVRSFIRENDSLFVPFQFGLRYSNTKVSNYRRNLFDLYQPELPSWKFTGRLLPEQQDLKEKMMPTLRAKGSVCCFLYPGWGKTIQATEAMAEMIGSTGGTGLVLVNKKVLPDQWKDTFEKNTDAKVEIIKTGRKKQEDDAHLLISMTAFIQH